jgi:hypothetical protein
MDVYYPRFGVFVFSLKSRKMITENSDVIYATVVNNYELIKIYKDEKSGTNARRKEFIEMMYDAGVFCKIKVQRIAMKNTECCHPIFLLFSRQRIG